MATGYDIGQNQHGNTGKFQYMPQLRDQNAHAEMLHAMALRQGGQGLDSSYHHWGQDSGQPPPGEYGPRWVG